MGCDIHLNVEAKVWDGVWWKLYTEAELDDECNANGAQWGCPIGERHYAVFGKLAGVRRDTEPIVPLRGYPSDASRESREDYDEWEGDHHSTTWLLASEILDADWSDVPQMDPAFFEHVRLHCGEHPPEHIRFIMWFDN